MNRATTTRLIAASALALMRWEPRLRLTRIQVFIGSADSAGTVTVSLSGTRTDGPLRGKPVALSFPLSKRGAA